MQNMAQALRVHRSLSRQTRSPSFHAFIKAHSGKIPRSVLAFGEVYFICWKEITADHALSLMESKHLQKAAIHMDAVKAELKSGLMEGLKSSLDRNAVRFRLGGKCSFSDQKPSASLSRRDETLLM